MCVCVCVSVRRPFIDDDTIVLSSINVRPVSYTPMKALRHAPKRQLSDLVFDSRYEIRSQTLSPATVGSSPVSYLSRFNTFVLLSVLQVAAEGTNDCEFVETEIKHRLTIFMYKPLDEISSPRPVFTSAANLLLIKF